MDHEDSERLVRIETKLDIFLPKVTAIENRERGYIVGLLATAVTAIGAAIAALFGHELRS